MRLPIAGLSAAADLVARQASSSDNSSVLPTSPLPEKQALCNSSIYCPGSQILQSVQLAQLFTDSKTFVDKPTLVPESQVLEAFSQLGDGNGSDITRGQLLDFVNANFGDEETSLVQADLGDEFKERPDVLNNVSDPVIQDWTRQVHGYWQDLARTTNQTGLCDGCVSSFIDFEERRTFVVAGGRFRETYLWDTYWIIKGLLKSELYSVTKDILENFGDLIEYYGYIPNGNRIYYLNRSQPPLFTQMVADYIEATGDESVLSRLLPLLDREQSFWLNNRTTTVDSPYSGKQHNISFYSPYWSAPRPESYYEDYNTVELAQQEQNLNLSSSEKNQLYSDIAAGAESGWDFSAIRWSKRPTVNLTNTDAPLRYLDTSRQVPVDLNAILYRNFLTLADFYSRNVSSDNSSVASNNTAQDLWTQRAESRRSAILDLNWDPARLWYYDFNQTANARAGNWTSNGVWPYWAGILPDEVANNASAAQSSFAGLRYFFDSYNGTVPTTFVRTGQQWDFNAWPPLSQVAVAALARLPSNLTQDGPTPAPNGSFALLPRNGSLNQYGLDQSNLPEQNIVGTNTSLYQDLSAIGRTSQNNGSDPVQPLTNVGEPRSNESWSDALVRTVANRYISSALCAWHNSGGVVNVTSEQDPDGNFRNTVSNSTLQQEGVGGAQGLMFEKFSPLGGPGSGGEYEVATGFGWTNGVTLWLVGEYGDLLQRPTCGPATDAYGNIVGGEDEG